MNKNNKPVVCDAYVDNIGRIGQYATKTQAIAAVRETIKNSARADKHGYVLDANGEIIWEVGANVHDVKTPADKSATWKTIRDQLQKITDAADMIEGFELEEEDQIEQITTIKAAVRRVREAAHDYIKPNQGN